MPKGIYCLEGFWSKSILDKSSVYPILELLEKTNICKHIYHSCGTLDELKFVLERYKTKKIQTSYPILYFAFHGLPGKIQIDNKVSFSLIQLGNLLENTCVGKVIFFASCETMNIHETRIQSFLKQTGAIAAIGYKSEVNWLLATAFELLILNALQEDKFDWRGIDKINSFIQENYRSIAKKLDFRMVVNKHIHFPRKRKPKA